VFQPILKSLHSELVVSYLDDVSLGGDAATVLNDFRHMETAAKQLGLEINYSKCEVVGHNDVIRALFVSHGICLLETSQSTVILLGAPLVVGNHLDAVLEGKRRELCLLIKRLKLMPSHDSLFLLRNILAAPRLMYLLRTAPCTDTILNVD
jgi:hypothetical protein